MQPCSIPLDERMDFSRDDELLDRIPHLKTKDCSEDYDSLDIRMEEFRCGFPKPLFKNPRIAAVGVHDRTALWGRCSQKAVPICREIGLGWQSICVCVTKGPNDAKWAPTLFIFVDDNTDRHLWRSTLILIFRMLQAEGALDLRVSIECGNFPKGYIFPIEFDNPLVTLWPKKLLGPVISIIESHSLDFGAIEVFRFGLKLKEASPTILITIKDEDDEEKEMIWGKARSDIMKHCQSEGVDLPVVLKTDLAAHKWPDHDAEFKLSRIYNQPVPMGHSIGVEPKGAGTLGGYLRLKDRKTGDVKIVGLTTYRAVRGSETSWPADIDEGFITWPQEKGYVQSPAEEDFNEEMRKLPIELSEKKARLETRYSEINVKGVQRPTPMEQRWVESVTRMEERLKLCKNLVKNDLKLGKILASSGFRTSRRGNHNLDWALIEIDDERMGENKLPDCFDAEGRIRDSLTRLNGSHVNRIYREPFVHGPTFFKTGRTSGLNFGQFSHIKSYVRTELPANSQNEAPPPIDTLEHVFVTLNRDRPWEDVTKQPFSQDGDAGSWLLSSAGNLAGLVWGTSGAGASYVTPVSELMADITKNTGMEVSFPDYSSVRDYEPEFRWFLQACAVPWLVDEPYTLPCSDSTLCYGYYVVKGNP